MQVNLNKNDILNHCKSLLAQRIENAEKAMNNAQESTISEDKSSAGDKFETSRAMGHMNKEMYAKQLVLLKQELAIINQIKLQNQYNKVVLGALVITNQNTIFIATGLGKIVVDKQEIMAISPHSPLGKLLALKMVGNTYTLNNQHFEILSIL